jgi:hypothetical protein
VAAVRAKLETGVMRFGCFAVVLAACGGSQPAPAPPTQPVAEPNVARLDTHVAEVVHPVDGITVDARPITFVGWTIAVHNDSDAMVRVVWSESSFVGTNNVSYGQLVESADGVHTRPLPPTLIPPHSVGGRPVATERQLGPEPREVVGVTNGGTLYLTIETNDQKRLWSGKLGS